MELDETQDGTEKQQEELQSRPEVQEPKKRGRKTKVNPAAEGNAQRETALNVPGGEAPKERKKKRKQIGFESMAKQIQGLHGFVAISTGIPELLLSEDESKLLAEAAVNFANEFDITINPKIVAGLQLFGACAIVYGPRILALKKRAAEAAKQNIVAPEPMQVPASDNQEVSMQ